MSADTTLTCRDCGQAFTFTSGEQDFYASRGFSEPSRCRRLPRARKAQRDGGSYSSYGSARPTAAAAAAVRPAAVPRRTRDVQRDVLELRPGGPGAVPAERRQAGVLLDCFQQRGGGGTAPADPLRRWRPARAPVRELASELVASSSNHCDRA